MLEAVLDATGYLDDTVEPDHSYVYEVIAVDDNDNRGAPASIAVSTPAAVNEPLINQENHTDLLVHVFSLYVGDIYSVNPPCSYIESQPWAFTSGQLELMPKMAAHSCSMPTRQPRKL